VTCNCKCNCNGEETEANMTTPEEPVVSNVSQGVASKTPAKKSLWSRFFGSETKKADCGCSSKASETTAKKITDLADWFNYPQREQFLFNSEINEPMNGSSNTVDHINPTEVQGSEDIMGAEQVIWPQFTQNISGQGRTFANTIHPGMVIPNPDNYPTPQGNNPWAPYVDIRTYGDILNAVYPPYPSAMEWATNPDNYQEYPSTDYAAEDSTKIFEAERRDRFGFNTNAPKSWKQPTAVIKPGWNYKNDGKVLMRTPKVKYEIRTKRKNGKLEMKKGETRQSVWQIWDSVEDAKRALELKNKQMCCHHNENGSRASFPKIYYWTDATSKKKKSRKGKKWWQR